MATRPTTEEIKTIEIELKTEQALPKVEASAKVETANPAEEAEKAFDLEMEALFEKPGRLRRRSWRSSKTACRQLTIKQRRWHRRNTHTWTMYRIV